MTQTVLHLDSSARTDGSTTRELTSRIVGKLAGNVIRRDLTQALPQIDDTWVISNFTAADERTEAQADALALSDELIAEIAAADVLVIGVPIYNFGIPAALKAWIDLVARAGVTFRYTENGPVGLLEGKRAILAVASGGTPVGSDIDFATGYMRHVLGFLGVSDVDVIAADHLMTEAEASIEKASRAIDALAA
jgi:FMN-dependent NADH-azoreductase